MVLAITVLVVRYSLVSIIAVYVIFGWTTKRNPTTVKVVAYAVLVEKKTLYIVINVVCV